MKNSIFILGLLWILMVACVPVMVVSSDVEPDVNFNDYKTFGFYKFNVEDKDNIFLTEPDFTLLKNAITSQMEKRNFKYQESNPDLMINLGILAQNKEQTRETDFRDGRMGYMGQRNYHWESEEVVVNKYAEGTVKLDMVDRNGKEMLWQGVIVGNITQNKKKMETRVNQGISELFQKFPVQPK